MRGFRLILSVFVFLSIGLTTVRAEVMIPQKLSLTEAVVAALHGNAGLKQAEESRLSSLSQLRIANLDTTFGIGGSTNLVDTPEDSTVSSRMYSSLTYKGLYGTEASLDLSPFGYGSERSSVGLAIRQPLIGGRGLLSDRANQIQDARSNAAVQNNNFYISRQSTVRDVISAYYNAVKAEEQIKVQESAVEIAEISLDGTRKRADAKLVAGIEVFRAEINVAQTLDALNLQRSTARGTMDRLMIAIGAGIGQTPELTDREPNTDFQMPTLDEAISKALANRSELTVYDERLSNQKRRLNVTKDALRPRLNLVTGFSSTDKDKGFMTGSLVDLGSFTTGLEFRFTLDKRIDIEERDTTARGLEVLQELRTYQTEVITEQVRRAYRSVESARTSLEIYSQNLSVAKDRLHIANRMVEEGEGSNREVLEAQESLTRVQSGMLSAKTELFLAYIDLRHAMGEDLTTMGSL